MEEEKDIKPYEISFLLKNEEDAALVVKKLSDHGAEIIGEGAVSYIRLTYPIKKEESAYFGYVHFKAAPEAIKSVSDSLKLEPKILRCHPASRKNYSTPSGLSAPNRPRRRTSCNRAQGRTTL